MILEGIVMPVGELNANGWGIPPAEVTNTISSLKQSVVRLCSALDHACDLQESRLHEIGKVIDAWSDGKNIRARTEISNDYAKSMVQDGKLQAWSVYGQGDQHSDGFVHNYLNKSLTLVADPAWSTAKFKTIAASRRFMLTNSFSEETMPKDSDEDKFIAGLEKVEASVDNVEKKVADLIAAKDKQINDLEAMVKKQAEDFAAMKTAFEASITKDEDAKDEPTEHYASKDDLEVIKNGIKTDADLDKFIASKLAAATEAQALHNATVSYKEFAASNNIKLADDFFAGKTSAMITSELDVLKTVTASITRPEPVYQSIPSEFIDDTRKMTVGIPDGKGGWN